VWILRYFFELYGLAPLAACAAPFLLRNATRQWAIGLLAAWLALVVYFATKPVFFERNLSHALIPMLLAAVLGVSALRRPAWRGAAVALIILPAGYWSIQIAAQTRQPESIARFEAAHGLNPKLRVFFAQVYTGEVPRQCETIAVQTFNDPWSAAYLARLAQERFEPIARYRSRFAPLVTSTLHTYLDPDMHYFRCPPT
jgi:hypothetical protein